MSIEFTDRFSLKPEHMPFSNHRTTYARRIYFLGVTRSDRLGLRGAYVRVPEKNIRWCPYVDLMNTVRITNSFSIEPLPRVSDEAYAEFAIVGEYIKTHWWDILLSMPNVA